MSESGIAFIYYHEYKPIHIYLVVRSQRKFGEMKFNGMIAMPNERKIENFTEYTYMYPISCYSDVVYAIVKIDGSNSIVSLKVSSGSDEEKQIAADLEWLRWFYVSFMKLCGDAGVSNETIILMVKIIWNMLKELDSLPNKDSYVQYKNIMFIKNTCDISIYNFDKIVSTRQTIHKKYCDLTRVS